MDVSAPHTYQHSEFRGWFGVARREITPSVGVWARCWGASLHDTATGVHRPTTATVLAVSQQWNSPLCVLAAIDIGAFASPEIELSLRSQIAARVGTTPDRILISLAHTHAGGPLYVGGDYSGKPGGDLASQAFEILTERLLEAVEEAVQRMVECVLTWDHGRCSLAANRESPDASGKRILVGFNPNHFADDYLLVGRICEPSGRWLATLVNYACHPTTMAFENRLLSPDYVGAARETIESHSDGAPCLFLQGASGELSPRYDFSSDPAIADQQGRQLGFAALSVLQGMLPAGKQLEFDREVESGTTLGKWELRDRQSSTDLHVTHIYVEMDLKPTLPVSPDIRSRIDQCADPVLLERLRRQLAVRSWVGEGSKTRFPVWIWRLGGAFLIGHPAEAYSKFQIDLRRHFPTHVLAVMNLCNGSTGYLPPADRYDYEIYSVYQTPYARGSLEALVESIQDTCKEILSK